MLDAAAASKDRPLQRMRGAAHVRWTARGLADLAQSGAAKAMLPRGPRGDGEVVFVNTAGGVTGGDRLALSMAVGRDARATATTQTAERIYAALPGDPARVDVTLDVAEGGRLDWIPQETILFERSDMVRATEARLAGDAALILAETLVLGRAAMGETLGAARLLDRRRILRDGAPVVVDATALDPATFADLSHPALWGGARAMALVAIVARGAEDAAAALRPHLAADHVRAEASGWDGRTVVRALAPDAAPLRRWLAALLTRIRAAPPPRVWQI